jgi:hypothetical protein
MLRRRCGVVKLAMNYRTTQDSNRSRLSAGCTSDAPGRKLQPAELRPSLGSRRGQFLPSFGQGMGRYWMAGVRL